MIELSDFLRALRRSTPYIILSALVLGVVFGLVLPRVDGAPRAEVLVSMSFGEFVAEESDQIAYDGYYVVEAERRFGDVLGQELLRPDAQKEVEDRSGVIMSRVARVSPLDYRVTLRNVDDEASAVSAGETIEGVFTTALTDAVERSGEPLVLSVTTAQPSMLSPVWSFWNAFIVGFVIGVFLAIFVVLMRLGSRKQGGIIVEEVVAQIEEL